MKAIKRTYAERPRRPQMPRISPLEAWDRTNEVLTLAARFALKPADRKHIIGRELTLCLAVHGKVRVMRGTAQRQHSGGQLTITDKDGFILGRSVSPESIVAWSADPVTDRLERSALKALAVLREESRIAFAAEWLATPAAAPSYAMAA